MARAVAGPIVAAVSGRVGGVVFRQVGARLQVQHRPCLSDERTLAQLYRRVQFAGACSAFLALSADERLQWSTAAANISRNVAEVRARRVSGRALFVSQFFRAVAFDATSPVSVPARLGAPMLASVVVTYAAGSLLIAYSKSPSANTGIVGVRGLRAFSPSGFKRRNYLTLGSAAYGSSGTLNWTAAFAARLGTPQVGEALSLEILAREDEGLWSLPWRVDLVRAS